MRDETDSGAARAAKTATAPALLLEVNGAAHHAEAGATVATLLAELGVDPIGVAVERNRRIVRRDAHASTALCDGDRIEIVTFVGGGCGGTRRG